MTQIVLRRGDRVSVRIGDYWVSGTVTDATDRIGGVTIMTRTRRVMVPWRDVCKRVRKVRIVHSEATA